MSTVLRRDDAKHAIDIFRSQVADEIGSVRPIASQNAGGIVFCSWSAGLPPSNRFYNPMSIFDALAIGRAALGYGVSNVSGEGRLGIWLKAYLDSPPFLLEFKAQDPKWVPGLVDGAALAQNKARLKVQAFRNGDRVGPLLLRVPHS